jgi:hypothetical protein
VYTGFGEEQTQEVVEMPFCPECGYEYVDDIERCADCDVELVDELPDDQEVDEMVPVYFSNDESEIMIIKGILEDAGIPVWEESDVLNELEPLGETHSPISVPASRLEEAKTVIKEALEAAKSLQSDMEIAE